MGRTNWRAIATRPAAQNRVWSQHLAMAGYSVLELPLLAIVPLDDPSALAQTRRQLMDFDLFHAVVFVSQNAVAHCADSLQDYWPQLPSGMRYFAIGEKTAAQVRQRLEVPAESAVAGMDTEALLAHADLQAVAGQRILICRGQGGRGTLGEALEARGAKVEYCELYRRCLPSSAAAQLAQTELNPRRDILVVFSGETLQNALQAAGDAGCLDVVQAMPVVLPGERVAAIARELGWQRVVVSSNASQQCMLDTLISEFS